MRHSYLLLKVLSFSCIFIFSHHSYGDSSGPVEIVTATQKNELWLNPGFYSYHFDRDRSLNSLNYGFGAEYRFSSVGSLTAGNFHNSYHHSSNYIGAYWQPIAVGPVKLGVVTGLFNGYANTNNGGWFPVLFPAASLEGSLLGLNLLVIPTIPNHVAGLVSLQLKIKLIE